jgi:hypothetical protein
MNETNAMFSRDDVIFKKACELAHIEATKRQASKYRRKIGSAYKMKSAATKAVKAEMKQGDVA